MVDPRILATLGLGLDVIGACLLAWELLNFRAHLDQQSRLTELAGLRAREQEERERVDAERGTLVYQGMTSPTAC